MNRSDQSYRHSRTWAERHPVLSEVIGIIVAIIIVTTATAMLFYAF